PPVFWRKPTAQASQGEGTATPLSPLSSVPGLGGWGGSTGWQAADDAVAGVAPAVTVPASISEKMSARASLPAGPRRYVMVARRRRVRLGWVMVSRLPKTGRPAL